VLGKMPWRRGLGKLAPRWLTQATCKPTTTLQNHGFESESDSPPQLWVNHGNISLSRVRHHTTRISAQRSACGKLLTRSSPTSTRRH
jgi:hypothetical protein